MSIYTYPDHSLIDEVHIHSTAGGVPRAYLHAGYGASSDALLGIVKGLREKGWDALPFNLDGKPMLEVRGFKKEKKLIEELEKEHWAKGEALHIPDENTASFTEKLRKRTLQGAGGLYIIGDYNFFRYGHKEKRWEDMLAGLMYFGGTMSLATSGANDQSEHQIKNLSQKITAHLMKQSIRLPESSGLQHIVKEEPVEGIGKVAEVFKRYPSEMFNLFTGLAGACITASALRYKVLGKHGPMAADELKKLKTAGWLDVGLGTLTMASTAVGGLVTEKAHDPDKPYSKGVKGVMEWVQERPLTVSGAGLMVSTLCHAASSYIEYFHAKRMGNPVSQSAIINRSLFVATNLVAEFLIAISSKGHGHGVKSDGSVDDTVVALTAELIAKRPKETHADLIEYMSKFLGSQSMLARKNDEIKEQLTNQVDIMCKNPWTIATSDKTILQSSAALPAWQSKVSTQPTTSSQLST